MKTTKPNIIGMSIAKFMAADGLHLTVKCRVENPDVIPTKEEMITWLKETIAEIKSSTSFE